MAQIVDYWANNIVYSQGPFVVVYNKKNGQYYIGSKMNGHMCGMPVTLHPSIVALLHKNEFTIIEGTECGAMIKAVDWLNNAYNTNKFHFVFSKAGKYGGEALTVT